MREKKKASYEECIKMLDYIITDSEYSKQSILTNYSEVSSDKIEVMYAPMKFVDDNIDGISDSLSKSSILDLESL